MCTAATYKTKGAYYGRTLDYEFSPLIHPTKLILQDLEIKQKTKRRLNFSMDIPSHNRKRSSIKL